MDTQVVELLGRNRLISELLRAGLEVAVPARDRGVDLIAYLDLESEVASFVARPIQMKASSGEHFSIDRKYQKVRDLILAFVWHLERPERAMTYALTYSEAIAIADEMGWTRTASWVDKGAYSTQNPSVKLAHLLEPYVMNAERWRRKVGQAPGSQEAI
jgi:hypothetical protein